MRPIYAALALLALTACSADSPLPLQPRPVPPAAMRGVAGIQSLCAPPPAGIVGWWRADSDTVDVVGGNDATRRNGTLYATGAVGDAFLMDGDDDDLLVGTKAALNVGQANGLTLQAWIHPEGPGVPTPNGSGPIFEYLNGVHLWQFTDLWTSLGGLFLDVPDSTGASHVLEVMLGVTQQAWNHVAATYDKTSGVANLYINGAIVNTANIGMFTPVTGTDLHIGRRVPGQWGGVGAFHGRIDDAQVYNRSLTPAEILAAYNSGVAGACQLVAQAGAPANGTEGTSVSFNGSGSTGQATASYDWDFGDGSAHGTGATPAHTYKDNGGYTVTLTMHDGLLTSMAVTGATIGNLAPAPTLTLQTAPPIHVGQPFTLRAGFSDKGVGDAPWGYKLYRNTRLLQQGTKTKLPPPGATQPVAQTINTAGKYTFRLEITDKDGATGTATLVVQVVP
ncbi:MAG: PKD domain-containing protein [Gemmatimonadaceae bacterium]